MSEELYGQSAVGEDVGQTPTVPATGEETDRQPETGTGKTPAAKPITEEDFRKFQANADRRYEQARQEAAAARAAAQQYQQQLAQFSQQWEAQQLAAMPEEQRPLFENQRLRQTLQQMQAQQQQAQVEQMRWQAMQQMVAEAAEEGVKVTIDELSQHPNPDAAWRYVLKKGLQGNKAAQAARQQKREDNSVDLGGGAPVSNKSDLQTKYDKALKRNDAKAMLDAMYDAAAAGVELSI